jgi:hypothetical protein
MTVVYDIASNTNEHIVIDISKVLSLHITKPSRGDTVITPSGLYSLLL